MRFRGDGIGHKATHDATGALRQDRHATERDLYRSHFNLPDEDSDEEVSVPGKAVSDDSQEDDPIEKVAEDGEEPQSSGEESEGSTDSDLDPDWHGNWELNDKSDYDSEADGEYGEEEEYGFGTLN